MSNSSPFAIRNLNSSLNSLNKVFEKLASGKRINSAADDAAGLAIASALESSASVRGQAGRNIEDGQSALAIADGALGQVQEISTRLSELATQASNGTLSDDQRASLQQEYSQLSQEITRIAETTEFNGEKLLNGNSVQIQAGGNSSASSQISTAGVDVASLSSQVIAQDISTQAGAQQALSAVNSFIQNVPRSRGDIGAASVRLSTASSNNAVQRENELSAASRIRDVDIAEETSKLVAGKIKAQSALAVNAQASKLDGETVRRLLS